MNFDWDPGDTAFRAELREFLDAELPEDWDEIARHGPGSDETAPFSADSPPSAAASTRSEPTSSISAISALSPRRGPSLMIRV